MVGSVFSLTVHLFQMWHVKSSEDGTTSVEFASDLVRHQKAVNAVRFSPCGIYLASGDDGVCHY